MSGPALRLGVLADLHLSVAPYENAAWHNRYDFAGLTGRLKLAVDKFRAARVDAICLIGDLTHHGRDDALAPVADALDALDVPVLVAAGNHDRGANALLQALPGATAARPEGTYLGGLRVAGLQVITGRWFGARVEAPPAVEAWQDEPVILLSHFPVLSAADRLAERGMPYPGDMLGAGDTARMLIARDAPTVVISGHIHARESSSDRCVLQIIGAALVEAPYECTIVEIEPGSVTRRAIVLPGAAPDAPAPVLVPATEQFLFAGASWQPGTPPAQVNGTRAVRT